MIRIILNINKETSNKELLNEMIIHSNNNYIILSATRRNEKEIVEYLRGIFIGEKKAGSFGQNKYYYAVDYNILSNCRQLTQLLKTGQQYVK